MRFSPASNTVSHLLVTLLKNFGFFEIKSAKGALQINYSRSIILSVLFFTVPVKCILSN